MQFEKLLQRIKNYPGVSDDSRKVKKGFVFVAVVGIREDGHSFIKDAVNRGASVVVGEKDIKLEVPYVRVSDSRHALGVLASAFYENPSEKLKVIGVTGTDGKTTTANLIYWILKSAGGHVGVISTIGALVGQKMIDTGLHITNPDPLTLQKILSEMVAKDCGYAVVEVTSHGLDQKRVTGVAFDVGVLTNITHEHLDYHNSFESYVKAKSKLFASTRAAVLNRKDSSYKRIKRLIPKRVKISDYPVTLSKPLEEAIKERFPEDFNKANAQAAIGTVKVYGISEGAIASAITSFPQLPGRMEEIKTNKGFRVFVDFAHTPNALGNAILSLRKKIKKGKIIAIFGSAGVRDKDKRPMMGEASARLAEVSIFTAEDPRSEDVNEIISQIVTGAQKKLGKHKYFIIPERGEAITFAIGKLAQKGDIVGIFGKGHEKSMAYKDQEYPWSDQEAVRQAFKGKVLRIERGFDFEKLRYVHFTGIKGVGMTSLALCFDDLGVDVEGSDTEETFVTDEVLAKRNIPWKVGFSAKNISRKCEFLITTGAHGGLKNPEVIAAKKRKIPIMTHAEALAKMASGKETIAVCGVGGKSTASSMIAHLLEKAGLNPSFAIGVGNIFPLSTPGKFSGKGAHFICEADEFAVSPGVDDRPRFSLLNPKILVVTNVEHDHPDIYPTIEEAKRTFKNFFKKVPEDGFLVACIDNKNIKEIISDMRIPTVTYGFSSFADWQISDVTYSHGTTHFSLKHGEIRLTGLKISIPGGYNVLNAAAAFVVATLVGISSDVAKKGLASFEGVKRRFEFVGDAAGVKIYDDYAHHPMEIKAVLSAARQWFPQRRIIAVFQPHTYSRTKALFGEFAASFGGADVVAIMDIYSSARELKDSSVTGSKLAQEIRKSKKEAYYIGGHKEALSWLKKNMKVGDLLLTLGAGDIFYLHKILLKNEIS